MTKDGLDPLLPESENTAAIIQPPTEEEMNSAITRTVGNLLAVVGLHISTASFRDELTGNS